MAANKEKQQTQLSANRAGRGNPEILPVWTGTKQ
jgi:hypothetical protein